jgi:anti-anti-sigma factor
VDHPDGPAPIEETQPEVTLSLGEPSVIRVSGALDLASVAPLRQALDEALDHHPRLVLDLAGVTFADSTFLNVLLRARATAVERSGGVSLSGSSSRIDRLLAVTGTTGLFPTAVRDHS